MHLVFSILCSYWSKEYLAAGNSFHAIPSMIVYVCVSTRTTITIPTETNRITESATK